MSRFKLFVILSTACLAGYVWVAVTYFRQVAHAIEPGVCIFKHLTTIPCPSCGSTRSVLSIIKGDFLEALLCNPIGIILIIILLGAPLWVIFDLVSRKATLLNAYTTAELFFRRKWVAIPAILLVLMNWIWNISKGL